MFYILFISYFLVFCYGFKKLSYFKYSDFAFTTIVTIYCIKIITGIFYGYYFALPQQALKADTWEYFLDSQQETDWLLSNPKAFIADLFTSHYSSTGNLFTSSHSYWSDLKATFFIKVLAVLNVITNKNYYINLLFFNALFMYGGLALYKLFANHFKINKWLLLATVFFVPSFLFWCSSIHKDGVVFSATAISLYVFNNILYKKVTAKRLGIFLCCMVVIFVLRNYYLLAILPALFSWFLCVKYKTSSPKVFALTIIACLSIFFFAKLFKITNSISQSIVTKHNEFQLLEGNTRFETPVLENTSESLLSYFPFAIKSSLLRPFIKKQIPIAQLAMAVENYFVLILLVISIVFAVVKRKLTHPLLFTCFTISFLLLLFIGYTVCFDGAIVRYKSISLPFLLVPIVVLLWGNGKQQSTPMMMSKICNIT